MSKVDKKYIGDKVLTNREKVYQLYGINEAIELLRPGAKWEWTGGVGFSRWDDPRPCPSKKEVEETMEKIKAFEDSINTIWTEEQINNINNHENLLNG